MTDVARTNKALVIVPTYNEAENIEHIVGDILEQPVPVDVLVVDDNSPDGTGDLADGLAARYERVSVLHRPSKLGLGTAYQAGFARAIERGYRYAIEMDADFSHNPRYLSDLLALMDEHDLGIGSRYVRGGGTTGWTLSRQILSRGANAFAKIVLGLKTHDCTAGFRCYKTSVLQAIHVENIFSSGYSIQVEMTTRCEHRGYSVGELPIIFDNRRLGRSKVSRGEVIKSLYTIFRLRFPRLPWERWLAASRRRRDARDAP